MIAGRAAGQKGWSLLPSPDSDGLLPAAAILALFACSSMLLMHLGFNYGTPGGSPLGKIHPATFMACGVMALLVRARGFRAAIDAPLGRFPEIAIAFAGFVGFTGYIVVALGRPFTFVIDTLFLALLLFLILAQTDERGRSLLAKALHVFMSVNALIAIVEMLTAWRLVPFYLPEGAVTWDWRSTAMLGHPLANANITSVYIILLALGAGSLGARTRVALVLLQLAAMAAFGGRAATAVAALVVGVALALQFALALRRGRLSLAQAVGAILAPPVFALCVYGLAEAGFFARFVERTFDDQGSAETRVRMFDLFDSFTLGEIIVGPNSDVLATQAHELGLDYGIESFVISYILNFGGAASAMVFTGFLALSIAICRARGWRAAIALAGFFAINATSTGISSKSTSLAQVAVLAMAMLPPRQAKRTAGSGVTRASLPLSSSTPRPGRSGIDSQPSESSLKGSVRMPST